MKKKFLTILLLCFFSSILATTFAQEANDDTTDKDTGVGYLGFVDIEFCENDGSDNSIEQKNNGVTYHMEQGGKHDICFELKNASDDPIAVKIHFVDGAVTIDSTRKRSCKSNDFTDKFGQYVSKYDKLVTIPAFSSIQQDAIVELPEEYVGHLLGCIAIEVFSTEKKSSDGLFDIVLRKAKFVDVVVDGEINSSLSYISSEKHDVTSNTISDDLLYLETIDNSSYAIHIGLSNTGQLDQNSSHTLTIQNMIGQTIFEETKDIRVEAGTRQDLSFNITALPWYKGLFSFSLYTAYKPHIQFESESITTAMKKEKILEADASLFLIPRWILIVVAGLILLHIIIKKTIKKRRRKHHNNGLPMKNIGGMAPSTTNIPNQNLNQGIPTQNGFQQSSMVPPVGSPNQSNNMGLSQNPAPVQTQNQQGYINGAQNMQQLPTNHAPGMNTQTQSFNQVVQQPTVVQQNNTMPNNQQINQMQTSNIQPQQRPVQQTNQAQPNNTTPTQNYQNQPNVNNPYNNQQQTPQNT